MKSIFKVFTVSAMVVGTFVYGQSNATKITKKDIEAIKTLANNDEKRLVTIFKDIHQNPELPFKEVRTAAIVAKEFQRLGYKVLTNVGITGVVGILENGKGPVIMYRGDMDCNAVKETTGLDYASTQTTKNDDGIVVPVAHMCGHDAHTTWLMGVAKTMVELKSKWKGTLVLVGQPAEENGFGAIKMAEEMYKKGVPVADYLLGMHTAPVGIGLYLNMSGDRMAGADQLDVVFHGISGHGSMPQETKDPIIMAVNAITQYQTIVSRNMDPQRAAVLTIGAINGGIDNNVIPESVTVKVNLRWFSEKDRMIMIDGIKRINEAVAVANGLPKEMYPTFIEKQRVSPLKNDKGLVDKLNPALEEVFGPSRNLQFPPVMGSEDFQHLIVDGQKTVYDYLLLGIVDPALFEKTQKEGKMFPYTNHNGNFMVDLKAIPLGVVVGTTMLLQAFN
nr:amidohydrolase [uncultured Flavobacterium sp.]